uniref:Ribonuclease H-like domain-containing protein n=1 Tax=Tanacetum cinerariifolium TaxID=118510 RepID=A0A699I8D1_TANCI|nr:ribonuclease H-like domain-containing protein [Tanacetum cinerariifolium]
MGLDDFYMQIRSSILSREVLADVRNDYAIISSKESHIVVVGSIAGSSQRNQTSAFVSNVPNSQNFQRSDQNFSTRPSRPNNMNHNRQGGGYGLNNNRQDGGSGLMCENCVFNGHTIDRCFKIIGYLADFGTKKYGQSFKKKMLLNNNSVGKSSSSEFTNEQMITLISLIKYNKVGKNIQANMAGHPNGTEAYICKIGNLRLSNGLTLYDDLNLKNVLGIGEQCEGLYYYNDQDPVLNVIKDSLQIDKKDNIVCCEICQRAKQTREPFPLSDHISKRDVKFFENILPFKDSEVEQNDSANIFQDVNHINYFDIEYPEIPNDDVRVANDLNKNKSDSSSSSVSGSNIITADFLVDNSGNDAYSSDELVAKLEENHVSEDSLD